MNFGQKIGYAALSSVMWLLSKLPLKVHHVLGAWVSHLVFSVAKYRTDDVMMNLSRAFPKMQIHELKEIRKKFYRQFGNIFAEAVWFGGCTNVERLRKSEIVKMTNPEVLNEFYNKGKSAVVLASHNGNWEIFGGYITYGSYNGPLLLPENDLSVVYLRQSDAVWNKFLFKNRLAPVVDKKNFDGLQESRDIMRYVYNNKDQRKLYIFITDQRPYFDSPANLEVTFMNQKVKSMTGALALAKMMGMGVVYQNMKPDGKGHYEISFTKISDDASSMEIQDMIDQYYILLEKDIKETPWNYLWTHRRWS